MKTNYFDIYELAKLSSRTDCNVPKWYDENGVPRWCEFHTSFLSNVHANECALIDIECQSCKKKFTVAISQNYFPEEKLVFDYGDPPNVDCCMVGPSQRAVSIRILEYYKHVGILWERDYEVEKMDIYQKWMKEFLIIRN